MAVSSKATIVKPGESFKYLMPSDLYSYLSVGRDGGKGYGLCEVVMQPESITPSRIETEADEAHYILQGEIEYQLDEQTIVATPTTFLCIPKGQRHSFKNVGSTPAKILLWFMPQGESSNFFASLDEQ